MSTSRSTAVVVAWGAYAGPGLAAALDGLLAQEPTPRIVLVDNAATPPLVAPDGVELVRAPRRLSLGRARDLGLAHVHTPFVLAWDADDEVLPGTLAHLEALLDADDARVAAGAAILDAATGRRHRWPRRAAARLTRRPRAFALLNATWSCLPTTGATLLRADAVAAAGGFGAGEAGEDWVLGAALAFHGPVAWSERPGRRYGRATGPGVWAAHATPRDLVAHARAVRERLAADAAVPRALRSRPGRATLAAAQLAAIGLHLVVDAGRRQRSR